MTDPAVPAVFVYGTLMPGRLRWPLVEPEVVARRADSIAGTLLDTLRGYPALVLEPAATVHGWLLELDPARAGAVLERLDVIEGPEYRRVRVRTASGATAQTYVFTGDPSPFVPLASGRWEALDER